MPSPPPAFRLESLLIRRLELRASTFVLFTPSDTWFSILSPSSGKRRGSVEYPLDTNAY